MTTKRRSKPTRNEINPERLYSVVASTVRSTLEVDLKHLANIWAELNTVNKRLDELTTAMSATTLTATNPCPHRQDESEGEKASRYAEKIIKLRREHLMNAGTLAFLSGVLSHIRNEGYVSTRQAAVVDRIIGEYS